MRWLVTWRIWAGIRLAWYSKRLKPESAMVNRKKQVNRYPVNCPVAAVSVPVMYVLCTAFTQR